MRGDDHLIHFLRDTGLLSRGQIETLERESATSGEPFYTVLLRSGILEEDETRRALSRSLGIPFVTLQPDDISPEALFLLPEAFCRTHTVFAYRLEGDRLMVATTDLAVVEQIERLRLPFTIVPNLTDRQTIKRGLLKYQRVLRERYAKLIPEQSQAINPALSPSIDDIRYSAERLSVTYVIDALLEHALSQSASDIHLEPRPGGLLVRYRLGGALYDAMQLPTYAAKSIIDRLKMLAQLDLESHEPQDGRFKIALRSGRDSEHIAFRISTLPTVSDVAPEKVLIRIAEEKTGKRGFTLESLGFHGAGLDVIQELLHARGGLIVVCGGSRSGTTTLLYSLIDQLVDPTRSVVTVEDFIEYTIPGAVQIQTDIQEGTTLRTRLESALRMDADVLMVSQSSHEDVATQVAHAANRGRLVITSVPAQTALEGLQDLCKNVELPLLTSVLRGVITTRLVRKLCPTHEKTKLSRTELDELEARGARLPKVLNALKEEGSLDAGAQWKDVLFGRAKECSACEGGYVGVVGVQEVVPMTLTVKDALLSERFERVEEEIRTSERLTLLEDGMFKAAIGLTSIEEVLEASL